jgi:RNA polymerase sigma-70 factor (ECF subfamily)
MASLSDIENCIARMALGVRASFEALYQATSAKLFGVCLRVLKNNPLAQEALQETYVKIWHHAGRYEVNGLSPMSWLITIARNCAIDHLRARKSGEVSAAPELMEAVADSAAGPAMLIELRSEVERLGVCLTELDDLCSEAVRGAYLDGKTYVQFAEDADVPLKTMRTLLRRSLIKLRECLTR